MWRASTEVGLLSPLVSEDKQKTGAKTTLRAGYIVLMLCQSELAEHIDVVMIMQA